jgi:K+-sensing histidine kinase KdpD
MTAEAKRLRALEVWIGWLRLAAVAWAVLEVAVAAHDYPAGYRAWAWATTAVLATGAVAFVALARRTWSERGWQALGLAALVFDAVLVYAYFAIYAFEEGIPARGLVYVVIIEAAVRFGIRGGVAASVASVPLLALVEWSRAERFAPMEFAARDVVIPFAIELIIGLIVGGLVQQLRRETRIAEERAAEAEQLRDEIGRHADQLEIVNRAARALSSSLELEQAFRLFTREVRSALSFDRLALVLAEGERALVIANAGVAENTVFPKGSVHGLEGSLTADFLEHPRTIVRDDMEGSPYWEERALVDAGLRSRVIAPLVLAGRTLGFISVSRREAHAFTREDADLLTILGRQLATALENIRAFEAERAAAEELRRLSALRADFVSLVSHELRGPMASVIGCAATLRQRWRTLRPEQRESFLALIEEETSRLAALVGDVLDTSRLEAGTFTYTFSDVDVEELVREVAAAVDMGQEEVVVRAEVTGPLPAVRADRERIRQVLVNLLSNAVKYTVAGDEVEVRAGVEDGAVEVSVRDNGPGIASDDQRTIFEKFGRASTARGSKPGAGLGLFIARSITEAHGGSLEVVSQEGAGATFTMRLPTATA